LGKISTQRQQIASFWEVSALLSMQTRICSKLPSAAARKRGNLPHERKKPWTAFHVVWALESASSSALDNIWTDVAVGDLRRVGDELSEERPEKVDPNAVDEAGTPVALALVSCSVP
jgi:hypothetical protein